MILNSEKKETKYVDDLKMKILPISFKGKLISFVLFPFNFFSGLAFIFFGDFNSLLFAEKLHSVKQLRHQLVNVKATLDDRQDLVRGTISRYDQKERQLVRIHSP